MGLSHSVVPAIRTEAGRPSARYPHAVRAIVRMLGTGETAPGLLLPRRQEGHAASLTGRAVVVAQWDRPLHIPSVGPLLSLRPAQFN